MSEFYNKFCVHCKHKWEPRHGSYIDWLCMAEPQPRPVLNYVTGVVEHQEKVYCRLRNKDGECPYYEKREQTTLERMIDRMTR